MIVVRPPPKPKSAPRAARMSESSLTQCALKFAAAVANPWSDLAIGACLPLEPARRSQKVTSFLRFNAQVGTNGFGFVYVSPCLANNVPSVFYTDSSYAGTMNSAGTFGSNIFISGGIKFTGVSQANINSPYSTSSLGTLSSDNANDPAVMGRIVSVGVKATYTGTTLNESGLITCYVSPEHNDLSTLSYAQLQTLAETSNRSFTRAPCVLVAIPSSPDEGLYDRSTIISASNASNPNTQPIAAAYPWSDTPIINGGTNNYLGQTPMVIAFTGVVGSTVFVELIQHSEFIGKTVEAVSTPSDNDIVGYNKVAAATNKAYAIHAAKPASGWSRAFMAGLKEVWEDIKPVAKTAAIGALTAILL